MKIKEELDNFRASTSGAISGEKRDAIPTTAERKTLLSWRTARHIKLFTKNDASESKQINPSSGGGYLFVKSFLAFVLSPAIIALVYFSIFASDVYVVESKITVREAITPESGASIGAGSSSSILGSLGIGKSTGTAQDTLIILDYVKSSAVIDAIGAKETMKSYFARPDIDYFSRLGSKQDMESLRYYWRDHVIASVDTQSNILTLKVMAYSPVDAFELSKSILAKSEQLINYISQRNRQDALTRAQEEVARSISQLADAQTQILIFQQKNSTLDPVETAKQITELSSSLSLKKIELESRLAASALSGISNSPNDRFVKTQLDVLDAQILNLKNALTGDKQPNNISQQLKDFEILKLRYSFAEQVHTLARTSFEEARRKLDKQQLYAVVVVPPFMPEKALYPTPLINSVLVFFGCFLIWAIASLIVTGIKDST